MSCLISAARASSVSRSPYSVMSCAAGLHPNSGNAGNVVGRIPDQRLHLDDLGGRHAEFLDDLGHPDLAVLHAVVHDDAIVHELHEVLVGADDGRGRACVAGLPHIGRDQIVGFVAVLLQARHVEGAHGRADERELGTQVVRRIRPLRLVSRVQLAAECFLRLVEHDREMGRPLLRVHVAHQLPQHVAEAEHGIDLQPVRLAVEWRQRVIGAEDIGGPIDQEHVVACCGGRPWTAGAGVALGAALAGMGRN